MNRKLKDLGFEAVKTGSQSKYIVVDDLGVITFSGSLRRELGIKRTESAVIYFNGSEGVLGIHVGTFDRKKNREMAIINISSEWTISAREELMAIEDEHRGYVLIAEEGRRNNFEDVEVEKFTEPPDPYSRMVLVTIKKERVSFREV